MASIALQAALTVAFFIAACSVAANANMGFNVLLIALTDLVFGVGAYYTLNHSKTAIGVGFLIGAATMMALFTEFKPGSGLHMVEERIATSEEGVASFEMTMAQKDARLTQEASGDEHLHVLPAVLAGMQRGIDLGRGSADFAAFAKP